MKRGNSRQLRFFLAIVQKHVDILIFLGVRSTQLTLFLETMPTKLIFLSVCVLLVGLLIVRSRQLNIFLQATFLEAAATLFFQDYHQQASALAPAPADIGDLATVLKNDKVETRRVPGKGYGLVATSKIYGRTECARFSANHPDEGAWIDQNHWADYKSKLSPAELDWTLRYAFAVREADSLGSPIIGHINPSKTNLGCRANEPSKGEKANAFAKKLIEGQYPVITLLAMRDILPGEEVTYDYGNNYKRHY